jgi:hypothetical protein
MCSTVSHQSDRFSFCLRACITGTHSLVPLQVANDESEGVLLTNERYDVTEGRRSGLELSPSLRRLLAVYLF